MMKLTVKTIGDLNKNLKNEEFISGLTKEALQGFKKDLKSKECLKYIDSLSEKTSIKVSGQIDSIIGNIDAQLLVVSVEEKASKKIKTNKKDDKKTGDDSKNKKTDDKNDKTDKQDKKDDKKEDKKDDKKGKKTNDTKDLYKLNDELIFIEEDKNGNEVAVITFVSCIRHNDTDTYVTLENVEDITETFKFKLVKRRKHIRLQDLKNKSTFEIISKKELSEISE